MKNKKISGILSIIVITTSTVLILQGVLGLLPDMTSGMKILWGIVGVIGGGYILNKLGFKVK